MGIKRRPPPGNVRRVIAKGQNNRGVFSNKAGRLVQFENWDEYTLMLQIDRRLDVCDFGSQPEILNYTDSRGRQSSCVPDFIVWRNDGAVELHIVRSTNALPNEAVQEREGVARRICQERGWIYCINTPQSLLQGTARANLRILLQYRPLVYSHRDVGNAVVALLKQQQPASLQEVAIILMKTLDLPKPRVVSALCHLLW